MNRKDKIQLLKDIQQGKTPVEDLSRPAMAIWYCDQNGLYSGPTQEKLTKEGYDAYRQKHPAKKTIVYKYQPGNEPL